MQFKIKNRQFLFAAIIVFYLIPLLFFSTYSINLMSQHKSWMLLSLGLLLIVCGTLALMILLFYWEQSIRDKKQNSLLLPVQKSPLLFSVEKEEQKVTALNSSFNQITQPDELSNRIESKDLNLLHEALKAHQEQQGQLTNTLEMKNQEIEKEKKENQQLQFKIQQIAQDFADYKLFSEEQLKQKQLQLTTLQQIIEDQRTEVEKRQEQIYQLDTKVHDLSYEIKTLLYLNEEEAPSPKSSPIVKEEFLLSQAAFQGNWLDHQEISYAALDSLQANNSENPVQNSSEAIHLLKKCILIAQKLTGANYYNNESSRYREFSSSYYAIDQRRLFDNLRNETRALIIVYSPKEQKLLFANNESKTLLGWNPEKFVSDFSSIMHEGISDWKKALSLIPTASESQARLLAKTKNGQEVILNCHLSGVPTGLFRNYIIGVLYPT